MKSPETNNRRLRVALFGAGRIGLMHAGNLAIAPRTELAGVYDVDTAAAARAADLTETKAFDSVDAALADESVQAVLIATSTETHCDLIERAAQAGKAILCEKPIHLDIERVDACRAIVAESGASVQIGFNRRFDPSHAALRQAVLKNELGRLELAVITSRDPMPPPMDYLRGSGGLYRDMMIHDFDMARFLFGEEPVEVTAMGSVLVDRDIGSVGDVDTAMVILRMESGALCHINCSRRSRYGYDQRIELFGEGGMLISTNPTATQVERYTEMRTGIRDRLSDFFLDRYEKSYLRELDAFAAAYEEGRQPTPSFEDGRQALLLANAAEESARTGRTVRVGA